MLSSLGDDSIQCLPYKKKSEIAREISPHKNKNLTNWVSVIEHKKKSSFYGTHAHKKIKIKIIYFFLIKRRLKDWVGVIIKHEEKKKRGNRKA